MTTKIALTGDKGPHYPAKYILWPVNPPYSNRTKLEFLLGQLPAGSHI